MAESSDGGDGGGLEQQFDLVTVQKVEKLINQGFNQ
jgi:hypothetical protein